MVTLNGYGEYVMEDNETIKEAQDTAYKEAMRSIAQQAVTHIKVNSVSVDAQLLHDEVELMANALFTVKEKHFQRKVLPDGKLQILAFLTVELDEEKSEKLLQESIEQRNAKSKLEKNKDEYSEKQNQRILLEREYDENQQMVATGFIVKGDNFLKQDMVDDALKCYEKAIEIKPDISKAYSRRARIRIEQGNLDKAEEDCRRAISLDDKNADAHWWLAMILDAYGKKEAISEYRLFVEYANIVEHGEQVTRALKRINELGG